MLTRAHVKPFLIRWMINTIALSAAVQVIPGIHFTDGPLQLLAVALVFGVVNAVLRPVLTVLSCPLVLLTLGLFTLVINGVMLMLTARLAAIWRQRADRYSEIRTGNTAPIPKIEMSYIGG